MESIKSQTLDDQRTEVADAAVRNVGKESQQGKQPDFIVKICLLDLRPINLLLVNAGLVFPHTRNHQEPFFA